MTVDFLIRRFQDFGRQAAIIWRGRCFSFHWLLRATEAWRQKVSDFGIAAGNVVALKADFSPNGVALFLALIQHGCIVAPLVAAAAFAEKSLLQTAQCEFALRVDENDRVEMARLSSSARHALYDRLIEQSHPGLVLFSSGSTGPGKAVLHDMHLILEKFKRLRQAYRGISFLLYDHIGGINTMLHLLSNGGCLVTLKGRSPEAVLQTIEMHRVELLPTSPTFINLMLLSDAHRHHDLSTLKVITYGTEPMPAVTLKRLHEILPGVQLRQTYGLSEIGIMRSKSKRSDSPWLKIGGEGYKIRIVDGILRIKARSAMLGYLNHPDPFTADGWLITGDRVAQDGDYLRILGRESELINVGGEKVAPEVVEDVLQGLENVAQVTVYGRDNPLTGQMVCADVCLKAPEEKREFVKRLKRYCRRRLMPFMVPVKVNLMSRPLHNARFKKARNQHA